MCSSGNCDMAGIISGPVGNLVGMGIKALVNGAPIGPRTSEALKKPTEQENIKQFYDSVETHLKGMLQVLEPALEIKKILIGESKSAERERPANSKQPAIQYYSPQNLRKSQDSTCQTRRCSLKKTTSHFSTEKSNSKTRPQHSSKIEKSAENSTQLKSSSSNCKSSSKCKKDIPKGCCQSVTSEASYKSCCTSESKEKSSKSSVKVAKSKQQPKTCCMCDVNLKDNIILAVLPCQHLFCYTCLAVGSNKRCRKCDKSYDMKNVQEEVRLCFEQLAKVLQAREKQLLRQVQAVHNQQLTIVQSNSELVPSVPLIKVNLSRQQDLQDSILKFGELVLSDRNSIIVSDAEPYKIEEYVEADKDHISFDKSIKIDREEENIVVAERLESFPNSPCELSFNTSSEADITSENEITVLMNHNYSSSSDGLRENHNSPELLIAETQDENNRTKESKLHSKEDSFKSSDNALNHSKETEFEISEQAIRINEDCTVPERKDDLIVEKLDCFTKENDRNLLANENKDMYHSTDSGSPTETLEKNGDSLINKKAQDCDQHPKQIQQWLQQILVETETEPTIHEVEQFAEISRFKEFQFPLET